MTRVVAISNRVSVPRKGAAPGGLAVGVLAAMRAHGGLWIGWSGEVAEGDAGRVELTRRERLAFATFDLTRAEYDDFYLGFSNGALWPLFHHFLQAFHYSEEQYATYLRVNQRFAEHTVALLRADDLIWVHDYHLMPLASRLRSLGVSQRIGFFLHIPFPGFGAFRALPVHRELLQSLLAYDLVGFQTRDDLAGFHAAVAEVFGPGAVLADGSVRVGERQVSAQIFPIGVDVEEIQQASAAAPTTEAYRRIVAGLLGRRLIIGVDRLDYSKGLVERFRAYEKFLATYPENHNDVTFVQIAPLSRSDVAEYEVIRHALEQASGRTNGRFADPDWTPVRYLNKNVPHAALMGYLRAAKVALVTPLRDGMNLVAKEFIAAQDPADPGVLVLSTLAGAARELTTALLVNPYDVTGVAEALQTALWMPLPQRRERYEAMMQSLRSNDIHAWNRRFLEALQAPRSPLPSADSTVTARPARAGPRRSRHTFRHAATHHPER
ncbi:MAG TPA: trehalose-6-phosphate synthase [Steroidobacteraceae bacterium]|nr:trehalose-6-phosphate synthase [Steroidobacteraceae bacterium]